MSPHEIIKNAQLSNLIIIEDLEADKHNVAAAAILSAGTFVQAFKAMQTLYNNESDYFTDDTENTAIIKQVFEKQITAAEGAAQSNALWIERLNKLREPGAVVFNRDKFKVNDIIYQ